MNETFRESSIIPGYLVSDMGRVMNARTGRVFEGRINARTGYREVSVRCADKTRYYLVHRLVAEEFCDKPEGKSVEVNHINGIRSDERAVNLEWVTHGENLHHSFVIGNREQDVAPKAVLATNMATGEQMRFESIYRAARFLGISQGNICMCCRGMRPYASGYYWEYDDETNP